MIDYYEILEVSPKASQDVIRAVYNILMQRYDPDKDSNSPETDQMIITIRLAYDVLSDPEKRKSYDIELDKTRNVIIEFSQNHNFDELTTENTSEISRLKPDQVGDAVRSRSNGSNDSSVMSRLIWNRWGWILSILAVVFLLFSMVHPDPEKVKRGQLAVKLEAEREKEELEAEVRKKAAEGHKADTFESERKIVGPDKEKSTRTIAIDPAP
jgi:curved DNA-binding protein CbpA